MLLLSSCMSITSQANQSVFTQESKLKEKYTAEIRPSGKKGFQKVLL